MDTVLFCFVLCFSAFSTYQLSTLSSAQLPVTSLHCMYIFYQYILPLHM